MTDPVIRFRDVQKEFKTDFWKKKIQALRNVTFDVERGSIFGLIGPNGAGKTTSIKILMGLVKPTSGEALLMGQPTNTQAVKRRIGYLPENAYYYDFLKTEEVLDFYGRLFNLSRMERLKRTDELLEMVGLRDRKGLRLRNYSKGMLQRIGIAQALVNDPEVVILDEPMSGLDPVGRKEVRDVILRLKESGKTIMFSSHILPDVEAICQHVAMIIRGEVRAFGAIGDLVHAEVKSVEVTYRGNVTSVPDAVVRPGSDVSVVELSDPKRLDDLLEWGRAKNLDLISVVPQKESLEDVFLKKLGDTA